jgi:hypothetical protein
LPIKKKPTRRSALYFRSEITSPEQRQEQQRQQEQQPGRQQEQHHRPERRQEQRHQPEQRQEQQRQQEQRQERVPEQQREQVPEQVQLLLFCRRRTKKRPTGRRAGASVSSCVFPLQ